MSLVTTKPINVPIGFGGTGTVDFTWRFIEFPRPLRKPVVVTVPVLNAGDYRGGSNRAQTVSIAYVSQKGFYAKTDGGGNWIPETQNICWIAVDEGIHFIDDKVIEAGFLELSNGRYYTTTYYRWKQFTSPPAVIAQRMTWRNKKGGNTRIHDVTKSYFKIKVEPCDGDYDWSVADVVGYIAFEQGTYPSLKMQAYLTPREVTHSYKTYTFTYTYNSPPAVVAHLDSEYGPDNAHATIRDITATDFEVNVEEYEPWDGPHTTEIFSWVVLPKYQPMYKRMR